MTAQGKLQIKAITMLNAALLILLMFSTSISTYAQENDWKTLNDEVGALYQQGQYDRASLIAQKAIQIAEQEAGAGQPKVAVSLTYLAMIYQAQGLYAQAEPLFKRSLAIMEKAFGPDHLNVATGLNNLALLYEAQGQYTQAEPLFKRSLAIDEKVLGPDGPNVATVLNNLAQLFYYRGQYAQAEPLYKHSLAIMEKILGPDHPDVATGLNNLASLYQIQGQYSQAEPLYKRTLAIQEKALGPDHLNVALSLNNLAAMYEAQGQYAQAEPFYKRSLAIREKVLAPDHPDVAVSLNNLAELLYHQGRYAQAEPLYKHSLAILEKNLGPDHPYVAWGLNNLADLYQKQGQYTQAITLARRASLIYRLRIIAGGAGESTVQEAFNNNSGFNLHLSLLGKNPDKEPSHKIADEAFQVVQLEQASGTAAAIAKMAARFATGDDVLASLVKQKQDASERRNKEEAQLVSAASKPSYKRNLADEQRLRDDISQKVNEIEKYDTELSRRFPEYQELTRPEPVSIDKVRALLKPGEAMLVYALRDNGFLWVVKADGAVFLSLKANDKDIAAKVTDVRAKMESDIRPDNVAVLALHDLYQDLFAPALPYLKDVNFVMVVPAGPLQSLPFSMLVASAPPDIQSNADYRKVDWLARHYAVSVLPAVSSIQAFRQFAKAGKSQEPFAGFGDPLIGGADGSTRGKRGKIDVATVYRKRVLKASASPAKVAPDTATEIADVEAIRNAPRLPETADEIRAMAKVLKAGSNSIWLGENATETKVKHLDLSKYRTIAFATHGVMAGEVKGVGEPGLILTPPLQGTIEDDGYLAAGEIAKLKLNADWVVLSACNTAAADGTPGAEGLSGLAKAFFYAGARSLLVSNWPVASAATVPLTTGMLREYEANPNLGKAEAQRKAMMALMDTPDHPEYANPMFWAPFVVVGEGGAAK